MKLLCYFATPGGLSGGPRRLLTLCETLRAQGVTAQVASDAGSELLAAGEARGIATWPLEYPPVLSLRQRALLARRGPGFRLRVVLALLAQNLRFAALARRTRADGVWIRGGKGMAFAGVGAWLARRRIIWDVDYEPPSRGAIRWLHRLGLRLADAVVFQYTGAAEAIFGADSVRRYGGKFHAITPGIALARLDRWKAARRRPPTSPAAGWTILQVGTLCERKNQLLTVEAVAQLRRWGIRAPLRVRFVGSVFEQAYARRLRAAVAEAGLEATVEFLGWCEDTPQLMSEADLLVMPSLDEGVPNAVQEAMYLGLPVLVSDVGGMPEIVQHGNTGWVLPPREPTAWAAQMARCLADPKATAAVGQAAARYAAARFGTEAWGRRYAQIIAGR